MSGLSANLVRGIPDLEAVRVCMRESARCHACQCGRFRLLSFETYATLHASRVGEHALVHPRLFYSIHRVALQIEEEFKKILGAKTGSPESPFALTSAASKEVGAGINTGIQ